MKGRLWHTDVHEALQLMGYKQKNYGVITRPAGLWLK